MRPFDSYTIVQGVCFGNIAAADLYTTIVLGISSYSGLSWRGLESFKGILPSLYTIQTDHVLTALFMGASWTITRFVTEMGPQALAPNFFQGRRIRLLTIVSEFLAPFVATGCFYLVQSHFLDVKYPIEQHQLMYAGIWMLNNAMLSKRVARVWLVLFQNLDRVALEREGFFGLRFVRRP